MGECTYVTNCSVKRILFGKPKGRVHCRLVLELSDGRRIVFSEATVANIVRAYVGVKTHPIREAVEMRVSRLKDRKNGYAECQLIETREGEVVSEEIKAILERCSLQL